MAKKMVYAARSNKNGIIFYSNKYPYIGAETYIDKSGNIQRRFVPIEIGEYIKRNENAHLIRDFYIMAISILISTLPETLSFILATLYFSIIFLWQIVIILPPTLPIILQREVPYSTALFHSAEHMVLNAYKKLQKIPSMEEAKKFSIFHKGCGSKKKLNQVFVFTLLNTAAIFNFNRPFIYFISVLLIIFLYLVADKTGCLAFLQICILRKPHDREIIVAIEGLKNFEYMEECFKYRKRLDITYPTD